MVRHLFQQLYTTVDTLVVGRFVGKVALAAVGSTSVIVNLTVGIFTGLAAGAVVAIAQHFGARRWDEVHECVHTAMLLIILIGAFFMVTGFVLTPWALRAMGTTEEALPGAILYLRVYFLGMVPNVIYNMGTGVLRAIGDFRRPLYFLMAASLCNIVLDLLFVGVLRMGVGSAALATAISQAASALLCFIRLVRTNDIYQVKIREIRFHPAQLRQIISFGLPSGLQNSIISIANIVVQSNINKFGVMAVAGCGVYSKIEGFAFLPITCFAMALTTFIGQNLGARQYDRAKKGAAFGIVCSMTLAELVGVIVYSLIPYLAAAFDSSAEVVGFATRQAHVEALFYCFLAFSHCIAGIMRGAGKSAVPMFVMLVSWCIIRITYITITVHFIPKIQVIFWAYPLTWSISSIIFLVYFLKADWIHNFERAEQR